MVTLIGVLVFAFSFAFTKYVLRIEDEGLRLLVVLGFLFALWVPVELGIAFYLRRNKTLECVP